MRPRRTITWSEGHGYVISHTDGLSTTDRTLAEAIRNSLDRQDPLPCPHANGSSEIVNGLGHVLRVRCNDCGSSLEGDE